MRPIHEVTQRARQDVLQRWTQDALAQQIVGELDRIRRVAPLQRGQREKMRIEQNARDSVQAMVPGSDRDHLRAVQDLREVVRTRYQDAANAHKRTSIFIN